MRVCLKHLRKVTYDGVLPYYAKFLFIKYHFRNSCFYEYSELSLSKKIGKSRTFVRNTIRMARKHGWVEERDGNMIFLNKSRYQDKKLKRYSFIVIRKKLSVDEITKEIYSLLSLQKQRQVEYVCKKKLDLSNPTNLKAYKSARSHFKRTIGLPRAEKQLKNNCGEIDSSFNISYKRLGQTVFACSKTNAYYIMQRLKQSGDIEIINREEVYLEDVSYTSYKQIRSEIAPPHYWKDGKIMEILCNQYRNRVR